MNAFRTFLQQFARGLSAQRQHLTARPGEAMAAPCRRARIPDPLMLAIVVLSLTSIIGYRFYNQPSLKVNTRAPRTERAPRDASVIDEELTKQQRQEAETGSVQVLKLDEEANQAIQQKLDDFLAAIEQMRQTAGEFPFAEESHLSLQSQRYLRSTSDAEWAQIARAAERPSGQSRQDIAAGAQLMLPKPDDVGNARATQAVSSSTLSRQQAIAELQTYRQQIGENELQALLTQILVARQGYQQALNMSQLTAESEISPATQQLLLDLRDETWQDTRAALSQVAEQMLAQGIPRGLPDALLQQAVRTQLRPLVPQQIALPAAAEVLGSLLAPNLVEDKEATKLQAAQAAEQVAAVTYTIKRGDIIVRQGEPIDQRAFVLLDEFNKTERGIDWRGLVLTASAVTGAVGIFELVRRRTQVRLRCRDRLLLCLLSVVSVSTPALEILDIKHANFAATGLLVSSFYNPPVAVTQVSLLAGLTAFGSASSDRGGSSLALPPLLAVATGGLLAAAIAGRLRSREELALLGGAVGLSQAAVYLIATLIPSAAPSTIWSVQLGNAALFGLSGFAWIVVALGVSPYLEHLFDLVTPIRLAELANPNRPLLKRLATQAPGTFQHTLFVASLAEAAARELHANVELVRTGTLYHDIGKMHDPLGFIENQMGGPNKHDTIDNPYESAQIIKKHVSEGLIMARKHGLPQAVRDFIPEHQGTILISYFYFQAKQRAQASGCTVDEGDFRYDGPIPQSRETGIVMLADACEAALRSLKDATPETALSMVNKIFKARWQDGQLVESGLRREELPIVAEVFVRVWQQYNHQRIAYPPAALDSSELLAEKNLHNGASASLIPPPP